MFSRRSALLSCCALLVGCASARTAPELKPDPVVFAFKDETLNSTMNRAQVLADRLQQNVRFRWNEWAGWAEPGKKWKMQRVQE